MPEVNLLEAAPYGAALVISWLIAHAIKGATAITQKRELTLLQLMFISGGMPSAHAAVSVAIWAMITLNPASSGALIGLATLVVIVICYDAVKVRRSSGEQGEALRQLLIDQRSDIPLPRAARGHTPLEVLVGAAIGLAVGFVVYSTMI